MNKLLVISGGTKGIGRAIIMKFANSGFDIITCARNQEALIELKKKVEKEFGVSFVSCVADLSVRADIEVFVKLVKENQRSVEVLVNNAGLFIPGSIIKEEEGVLEGMVNSNLLSAYHLTRGLLGAMLKNQRGHVFNMCSVASLFAYPNGGSYSISKFALLGFSKVLREELKEQGIRVTAVMPGATKTASWEGVDLPDSRFMKPEDVAEAVYAAYTLSEQTVLEELILRPQLGDI